jgi:hypothetical protein
MKRQNPPQDHVNKAVELESFLSPLTIAAMYAIFGVVFALFVSVVYAVLVHGYILNPTRSITTIFEIVGGIPLLFAFFAYFLSPRDPVSSYIRRLADAWRHPLDVHPEECVFHELLMDGEALCFKLSFYYPPKNQTAFVKERIYTYVNGALAKGCSTRVSIPTDEEIQDMVDPPLEIIASECGIPVLYAATREVWRMRGAYSSELAPAEFWRTGTYQ